MLFFLSTFSACSDDEFLTCSAFHTGSTCTCFRCEQYLRLTTTPLSSRNQSGTWYPLCSSVNLVLSSPQILGGYVFDEFLGPWTLLIKSLGLVLSVASGLSVGKEVSGTLAESTRILGYNICISRVRLSMSRVAWRFYFPSYSRNICETKVSLVYYIDLISN